MANNIYSCFIALIGLALIIVGFVISNTKIFDNEIVVNYKAYKWTYKLTNIMFGIITLVIAYLYYKKLYITHWIIPIIYFVIVDILQRIINSIFIKEKDSATIQNEKEIKDEFEKTIDIDGILEEKEKIDIPQEDNPKQVQGNAIMLSKEEFIEMVRKNDGEEAAKAMEEHIKELMEKAKEEKLQSSTNKEENIVDTIKNNNLIQETVNNDDNE